METDENGNGSRGFPPDPDNRATQAIIKAAIDLIGQISTDVDDEERTTPFEALTLMGGYGHALGYERCLADLRSKAVAVRFDKDAELFTMLEGEEAERMLQELGIRKTDHP